MRSKILKTEPLLEEEARWARLIKTTYTDPNGVERTWEHAKRRTRPVNSDIDSVSIVAILEKPTGPEILLQKQFRPPLGKVVIEVPAGLVEACESAEQAAVRELKEETGYVSTVAETGPVLFNDPGFCNTNQRMVHVYIDGSHPSNQLSALRPELEDNEFIEVFTLPLASLREECRKLESQGYAIDAIIGSLAEGLEISRLFRGNKSDVGVK